MTAELQAELALIRQALGEIGDRTCGLGDLAQFGRRCPALASFAASYRDQRAAAVTSAPPRRGRNYAPIFNSTMDSDAA